MLDRARRAEASQPDSHSQSPALFPSRIPPKSRNVGRQGSVQRITTWESVPPDGVTLRNGVYRKSRLQLLTEERYRFMGGKNGGCIVEVMAFRKPVAFPARVGFLLLPRWSERSIQEESALIAEIDRDYLRGA